MKPEHLKKSKRPNWLAMAFVIPCVGMLIYMLFAQCEPFGKYSMLYSDMYHQYYPFFLAFRRALLSGDSLLYNWDVGLGMDYLGLISYYLASPLYLLSVFVPEGWTMEFFALLMPVKLGLAGLFFAVFLKNIFHRDDPSISLFGALYALCAWALGYQWNIMWLDTFALVPLVALGTVCLIRDRKFILYTLSLFLAIYANYYIGFFVCVFVALIFFVYEICRWRGFGRFFADLARIALFSLLAIGMTAILELPALAALQTTQSSVNNFPEGFRLNIADENTWKGLLDAMRQVAGNLSGGVEPTWKEGLPNLFCGVGTVYLGVLYLLSGDVKLRDKVCALLLLLFFTLSFIIRQLDYIWHGFHFTNMIPYRFSFLFSFVLLYMAYRAWTLRDRFRPWQSFLAAALTVGVFLCSDDRENYMFLLYNLGLLVVYLAVTLYGQFRVRVPDTQEREKERELRARDRRQSNAGICLLGVIFVEVVLILVNFGVNFSRTSVSNYPKGTEYSASMIRYMKEREEDTLFYRAEVTHSQTLNDGALNNYHGISTFTSSANVKVTEFMKALGYGAKNTYNRYCWEEASPVSDLFLGVKYMLDRDGHDKESGVWRYIHHYGNTRLYENRAYLPLGFLTEPELADVDFFQNGNTFALQNQIFSGATGLEEDVWHRLMGDDLSIAGESVDIIAQNSSGYCEYENAESGSHVIYSYVADEDGFFCFYANLPKRNGVVIRVNGTEIYTETTSLPQMMAVGDVQVGDVVDVVLSCKDGETGTMTLTAAILNMDRFWAGYEVLNASTMELTSFHNTRVEGHVEADRDGLLYTSIPQNGNWSVYVDGEEGEIVLVGDAMIGVRLSEGSHDITFRYRNQAFELGWKISLLCLLVFLTLVLVVYKPRLPVNHGKFAK